MYQLVQFIRHKIPFVWDIIELINTNIFRVRYERKLKSVKSLLPKYANGIITYSLAQTDDASKMVEFFQSQPHEAFEYFKPHDFNEKTICRIINNPAFIMILAKDHSGIVGYAFLRCFANGKSFRGKIVDINHRGKGIAKSFGLITTEIASTLGIGLFGTISKANISSMASSKSSNVIKIIEELPDDYLLIQYLPK